MPAFRPASAAVPTDAPPPDWGWDNDEDLIETDEGGSARAAARDEVVIIVDPEPNGSMPSAPPPGAFGAGPGAPAPGAAGARPPVQIPLSVFDPSVPTVQSTVIYPTPTMLASPERAAFAALFGGSTVDGIEHFLREAVDQMTEQRPYFKEKDVQAAVLRAVQLRASDREVRGPGGVPQVIKADKAMTALLEHPKCNALIEWAIGKYPFAHLNVPGYLTSRDMLRMEKSVLRVAQSTDPIFVQSRAVVDAAVARKTGISEEQVLAVHAATLSSKRVTVIEGSAGSGKTFSMEAVKEIYMDAGYHVMGTALGWNAAKVLGASAKLKNENCKALEGLTRAMLAAKENGIDPFQGPTLLIVDEAGMVGTRHLSIVLEAAESSMYPVKVVLTGDSLQVIPVNAGNPLELIIQFEGTTRIDTIRRQHQPSQRAAVANFSRKKSGPAVHTFLHQECFHWCSDKDALLNRVVQNYISYRVAHPNKKALVLALSNEDVLELNLRIRAAYRKLGLIGPQDIPQRVTDSRKTFETNFSLGDEVILRANDRNMIVYEIDPTTSPVDERAWKPMSLGVFNRNSGRIVGIRRAKKPVGSIDYIVDLGGDTPGRVIVNSETFKDASRPGLPMVHNYAGTIYGSQGQTVDHVCIIDNERMDFRLSYVGLSRHRGTVDVYLNESDLHRRLDKTAARAQTLEARLAMDRKGKRADDAVVDTGRYTRQAMLQAVALTWAKHSENLTCTMFEMINARGRRVAATDQPQPQIAPDPGSPWITDYVRENNTPYRQVDLAKIFDLPDPVVEAELVRPSDVEENRSHYSPLEMPVDEAATPLPLQADRADVSRSNPGVMRRDPITAEAGFFGRALAAIGAAAKKLVSDDEAGGAPSPADWSTPPPARLDGGAVVPNAAPVSGSAPVAAHAAAAPSAPHPKGPKRLADPTSAFDGVVGVDGSTPAADYFAATLARLNAWLNPQVKVDVPYLDDAPHSCGRIVFPPSDPDLEKKCRESGTPDARPHYLHFDGVPQVLNVEGGPDPEWLAAQRGTTWDIGRHSEPRILARAPNGAVAARYRLDGTSVVGNGEPPVWVNAAGAADSPVYIVAGAKEWFWLRQAMEERHAADPSKIPHIIWAAKDMDWGLIAPSLRHSSQVVVVRSKADDRQMPWARDMRDLLEGRHGIGAQISPSLPAHAERHGANPFARPGSPTPAQAAPVAPAAAPAAPAAVSPAPAPAPSRYRRR